MCHDWLNDSGHSLLMAVKKSDFGDSQRLIEIIFVVQLQTLHEISHRKNNFGALNR